MLSAQNLSAITLNQQSVFPELYAPLWWYSGSSIYTTNASVTGGLIGKGGVAGALTSPFQLYTVPSTANPNQLYAFEAAIWVASGTSTCGLYDITANTGSRVAGSVITTTSTIATVVRSGQFKLTPGHVYGVSNANSNAANAYVTDASLIIFPPAGSVSPSLSSISLSNPSGGSLKEAYIPLWVYSNGNYGVTVTGSLFSAGNWVVTKGSTASGSSANISTSGSSSHLHTLSSSWNTSQKFAFEAAILTANSNDTTYAALWDFTSSSVVSASQISTLSASFVVIRSGSFTLTPGHTYGITMWSNANSASAVTFLTKAHLVALGG